MVEIVSDTLVEERSFREGLLFRHAFDSRVIILVKNFCREGDRKIVSFG